MRKAVFFLLIVMLSPIVLAQAGNSSKIVDTKNRGSTLGSCRAVFVYTPIYSNAIYMNLIGAPAKSQDERWANEQKAKQFNQLVQRGERKGEYINRKMTDLVPPSQNGDYFSAESKVGAELSRGQVNTQLVLQAFDYCNSVPLN